MTTRRALILSSLAAAATASAGPMPASSRLSFRVVRKGSVIGSHIFDFVRDGDALTVNISVDITIGLGPVTVFRYRHRAIERWAGDTFAGIDAETNDDGTRHKVAVRREGTGLAVERMGGSRYIAPANAMAATHWNRRMLSVI